MPIYLFLFVAFKFSEFFKNQVEICSVQPTSFYFEWNRYIENKL